jgi:hypothetical protein
MEMAGRATPRGFRKAGLLQVGTDERISGTTDNTLDRAGARARGSLGELVR